jgi:hypothetical protein
LKFFQLIAVAAAAASKVVLAIVNEPPSTDPKFFKAEAMTYYGRWTYKFEEAARKGAVGALIIHRTDLASYPWQVVRSSWSNEQVYLSNDRDPKLQALNAKQTVNWLSGDEFEPIRLQGNAVH